MSSKIFAFFCILFFLGPVSSPSLQSGTNAVSQQNDGLAQTRRGAQRGAASAQKPGPTRVAPSFRQRANGRLHKLGIHALGNSSTNPPMFLGATVFMSGGWGAEGVVAADFNGDGKLDLAVANGCGATNCRNGSVGVLLGNGDGTYKAAVVYPSGGDEARAVIAGDFNHDGKMDLAVVNQNCQTQTCLNGSLTILLGNGDGTFQTAGSYDPGGDGISLAIGDLNGDGNLDIVSANLQADNIGVLLGRGDGTFQPVVTYATGAPWPLGPTSVVLGDFRGHGMLDLAFTIPLCTESCSSAFVGVQLGNGDGTFGPVVNYSAANFDPTFAAVGDFNGDGKLDLAISNGDGGVGVLLGNGDGTFQSPVGSASGVNSPGSLAVGDFNGDGKPDLAVASSGSVAVLVSNGDGTFQTSGIYEAGGDGPYVTAGDLNGDGKLDLVVSNQCPPGCTSGQSPILVLLGLGAGQFQTPAVYPRPSGIIPGAGVIGDFNGDGKPDFAVAQGCLGYNCDISQGSVGVFLGKGDGSLQSPSLTLVPDDLYLMSLAAGDFNQDGKLDLLVGNFCTDSFCNSGWVSVLLGNGDGTFRKTADFKAGGNGGGRVAAGHFNQDGKLDLAVATSQGVSILLGNGDGTFRPPSTYSIGNGTADSIAVGDFNGDGKPDLVVANLSPGGVSVMLGRGDGTFGPAVLYDSGPEGPTSVAVGDFNGDGKLDIAVVDCPICVSSNGTDVVALLLGNGDGTFQKPLTFDTGSYLGDISPTVAVGDINGDGKLDLLVTNVVMLGNGNGTFQAPLTYPVSAYNQFGEIGDFNGDGKPDLVLVGENQFTILLNITPGFQPPDFTLATNSPTSATVSAGSNASYSVTLRAMGEVTTGVSLACSGLPSGASCSFSPESPVIPTVPGISEAVTISTTGTTMAGTSRPLGHSSREHHLIYAMWLPLLGIALVGASWRSRQRRLGMALMCFLVIALALLMADCGGGASSSGGGNSPTPVGSYTIVVTATSGSLIHSTDLTLKVQ